MKNVIIFKGKVGWYVMLPKLDELRVVRILDTAKQAIEYADRL